jgi:ER-bound oxygenase mpaB/B'/Rubber oxygenase, catalytic domain
MDRMRASGDPRADAVIADFLSTNRISGLNELLGNIHATMADPSRTPASLLNYLEESARLPSWADPAKIRRAQNLFTLHGPLFGVVLLFKSLPILYAGGKGGAQVLTMTGQLTNHYRRRAAETLRFILNVMEPGGLDPDGRGIATTQKVRLMHAAIRAFAGETPRWKSHPDWGRPINQEELAGTMLAFSSVALEGLADLGLSLPSADKEAYLHAWKVIGHILGIHDDLMPDDMAQARSLWKRMVRRNFCKTQEGLLLIRDHQAFLDELLPGILLEEGVPTLLRFLMGRKISNQILCLPKASKPFALLHLLTDLLKLQSWGLRLFPGLAKAARHVSIRLMESLQAYLKVGHSKPFRIPAGMPQ